MTPELIAELAALALSAINAYHSASGIPITATSVLALLPNSTPLTPPDPPKE